MKVRTKIASLTGAGLLVAGLAFVPAGVANAWPYSCNTGGSDTGGRAQCNAGTGHYRVRILCANRWWGNYYFGEWRYGEWTAPSGQYHSTADCPLGKVRWGDPQIETKND